MVRLARIGRDIRQADLAAQSHFTRFMESLVYRYYHTGARIDSFSPHALQAPNAATVHVLPESRLVELSRGPLTPARPEARPHPRKLSQGQAILIGMGAMSLLLLAAYTSLLLVGLLLIVGIIAGGALYFATKRSSSTLRTMFVAESVTVLLAVIHQAVALMSVESLRTLANIFHAIHAATAPTPILTLALIGGFAWATQDLWRPAGARFLHWWNWRGAAIGVVSSAAAAEASITGNSWYMRGLSLTGLADQSGLSDAQKSIGLSA